MSSVEDLAQLLAGTPELRSKQDIATVVQGFGVGADSPIKVGDDAAAIPIKTGWQLVACEGLISPFVRDQPWFAGWCGVMVNLSDIAAMGGRTSAVVNALWSRDAPRALAVIEGMKAASAAFSVPIVGGHSNLRSDGEQLSVTAVGHANALLTSFDATPGDGLVLAIDLRGNYLRGPGFWDAATSAPPARLRRDLALLPMIAETGLSRAAKDVSQAGIVGTVIMLAESSNVGIEVHLDAIPRPPNVDLVQWLRSFPSYGYLITARGEKLDRIIRTFRDFEIAAAVIGTVDDSRKVSVQSQGEAALVRDLRTEPLTGCAPSEVGHA